MLCLRAKVTTKFVHILALRLCYMRRWLLSITRLTYSLAKRWRLSNVCRERTALRTWSLLRLDRAEVVTASMATMVNKVTVPERLLEVLTGLRLEAASAVLLTLACARTRARGYTIRIILMQAAAERLLRHHIVCIVFATLCWFHHLICLLCNLIARWGTHLTLKLMRFLRKGIFEVLEGVLTSRCGVSQEWLYSGRSRLIGRWKILCPIRIVVIIILYGFRGWGTELLLHSCKTVFFRVMIVVLNGHVHLLHLLVLHWQRVLGCSSRVMRVCCVWRLLMSDYRLRCIVLHLSTTSLEV